MKFGTSKWDNFIKAGYYDMIVYFELLHTFKKLYWIIFIIFNQGLIILVLADNTSYKYLNLFLDEFNCN